MVLRDTRRGENRDLRAVALATNNAPGVSCSAATFNHGPAVLSGIDEGLFDLLGWCRPTGMLTVYYSVDGCLRMPGRWTKIETNEDAIS